MRIKLVIVSVGMLIHLQKKSHTLEGVSMDVFLPSYRRSADLSRPSPCTSKQFVTISFYGTLCLFILLKAVGAIYQLAL
jgi:hypothetical protein